MTRIVRGLRYALAVGSVLMLHSQAAAQSDYVMSPVQFPSSFNVNAMAQVGKVYDDAPASESGVPVTSSAAVPGLTFTPSAKRRKANLAAIVRKTRALDPKGATEMERMFQASDVIADIDKSMRATFGMRANDVADAYAVWWMNAWQAAHGDMSDVSPKAALAVRAQAANALASTPAFSGVSDAAKQEMAESLLIQMSLIGASANHYRNDPAKRAELSTAVRKGARAMGVDLDAMTLTEQGFVPARKTGERDSFNSRDVRSAGASGSTLIGLALAGCAAGGFLMYRGQGRG